MGKIAFGIRVVGLEPNCLFEMTKCSYKITTLPQRETKVIVCFCMVWSKAKRTLIVLDWLPYTCLETSARPRAFDWRQSSPYWRGQLSIGVE